MCFAARVACWTSYNVGKVWTCSAFKSQGPLSHLSIIIVFLFIIGVEGCNLDADAYVIHPGDRIWVLKWWIAILIAGSWRFRGWVLCRTMREFGSSLLPLLSVFISSFLFLVLILMYLKTCGHFGFGGMNSLKLGFWETNLRTF